MSRRLVPVTRIDLVKRFTQLGWEGPVSGAKHGFMVKGKQKVRIPNEHRGEIGPGLLRTVLNEADISRDEWLG